jgi:cytochrome c553
MKLSSFVYGTLFALALPIVADVKKGEAQFAIFCAACHGPEGAGLVGPNLTDKEVLHGDKVEDIIRSISKGIDGKGMPAWESIIPKDDITNIAEFVKSIMGKNLKNPFEDAATSVTPFPKGVLQRPLLMRTFMPKEGLSDEVFANHYIGQDVPKYSPNTGEEHATKIDKPIEGIPGAIAVNFGPSLSYCFDSTECRLLYTWKGDFMDMTNYWGAGAGGGRKGFGYVPKVMGKISYLTHGKAPVTGKPQFKGYRKIQSIPEFIYSFDSVDFTLKITPGTQDGEAVCLYTSNSKNGLELNFDASDVAQMKCDKGRFDGNKLILNGEEATSFTITISPKL